MGIQCLIGPEVNPEVIDMGCGKEVAGGGEGEAGRRGVNQEDVYQSVGGKEEISLFHRSQSTLTPSDIYTRHTATTVELVSPATRQIPSPDTAVHC